MAKYPKTIARDCISWNRKDSTCDTKKSLNPFSKYTLTSFSSQSFKNQTSRIFSYLCFSCEKTNPLNCKSSNIAWASFFMKLKLLFLMSPRLVRDHSSITSAKRWVGGVRKWHFLLIYSTIYADLGGWVGLKKTKTCGRNTWMVPKRSMYNKKDFVATH